jgi:hypothetical protein
MAYLPRHIYFTYVHNSAISLSGAEAVFVTVTDIAYRRDTIKFTTLELFYYILTTHEKTR